jgi:uncharacterized membrane protein
LLLFGGFLVWALVDLVSAFQRKVVGPFGDRPSTLTGDVIAVVVGCAAYALMLLWGHRLITGMPLIG